MCKLRSMLEFKEDCKVYYTLGEKIMKEDKPLGIFIGLRNVFIIYIIIALIIYFI